MAHEFGFKVDDESQIISKFLCLIYVNLIEFFAFNAKLPEMVKDFTAAKKVACNGTRLDDHWIKSLMLIHLS